MTDAYVYQAALYCHDCAQSMAAPVMTAHDAMDQGATSDSAFIGPYPDGGGEADTPQHCDSCNTFLHNPLTTDGESYVKEQWNAHFEDADFETLPCFVEWREFYDYVWESWLADKMNSQTPADIFGADIGEVKDSHGFECYLVMSAIFDSPKVYDLGTPEDVSSSARHSGWYGDDHQWECFYGHAYRDDSIDWAEDYGVERYFGGVVSNQADSAWLLADTFETAQDAVNAADALAERIAESERMYHGAWDAGTRAAQLEMEADEKRAEYRSWLVTIQDLSFFRERYSPNSPDAKALDNAIEEYENRANNLIGEIEDADEETDNHVSEHKPCPVSELISCVPESRRTEQEMMIDAYTEGYENA